uniref:Uncharacterized protein n=1 Tax=Siphoviridae sp. ctoyo6 TaxID=2825674 RepID=A0A8S5U339_9CAUD|nr:MAG TPA: hypothetical protein [Siphoviridae sp. ctoyo6]
MSTFTLSTLATALRLSAVGLAFFHFDIVPTAKCASLSTQRIDFLFLAQSTDTFSYTLVTITSLFIHLIIINEFIDFLLILFYNESTTKHCYKNQHLSRISLIIISGMVLLYCFLSVCQCFLLIFISGKRKI